MRDNIVEVINGVGKFSEYDRNNSKTIDKYNDISFLYVSKIENSIMSITFDELEKMFLYLQRICDPFSSGITDASNAAR
ncbi:MAG: hypothetical protein NTX57_22680, partial [Armatimonadetes bacterium]|nr:hypothetical protein [Armatimonadota bacterium]